MNLYDWHRLYYWLCHAALIVCIMQQMWPLAFIFGMGILLIAVVLDGFVRDDAL